jgi:hypothetical protein
MRWMVMLFVCSMTVAPAYGQSLHLKEGERGVEASAGWSVGPASNGLETHVAVSVNGRVDVGTGISRYTLSFDDSSFRESSAFVRVFLVKEQHGAPVSLSVGAQVFVDDYGTDDSGRYVQLGTTVYKSFKLSEHFSLHPYAGFAFVAESYRFGDGPAERAQYLTRDFGLHFTTRVDRPWLLRLTVLEQSFRRETYRGARAAVLRRF